MSEVWHEYVPLSLARSGNMLPASKFHLMTPAYKTVYGFHEADAKDIRRAGHSRGFAQYEVFADRLTLDIDTGDEGLRLVLARMPEGVSYSLYSSGGKGFHVEIPHQPVWDKRLPEYHAEYVRIQFGDLVDTSLYQHGRVLSVVGRRHPKTGRHKCLIESVPGVIMELPKYDLPERAVYNTEAEIGFDAAIGAIYRRAINAPTPGNRHTAIWSLASICNRAAMSYDLTLALLQELNLSWPNPKPTEDVEKAVNQAYRRNTSDI